MGTIGQGLFFVAALVLDLLPERACKLLTDCISAGCYTICRARRANVRANLAACGGTVTRRKIYRVFRTHTRNIIEMFASSRWSDAEIARRIELDDRNLLEAALAAGKGAILATAHIGNWELPALYLSSLGYRVHVVAGVQMNALLSEPVRKAKQRRGISVVGPGRGYRDLLRALADGGIVALLVDGDVFSGGRPARLFGRTVLLPIGAARLGRITGAPVIAASARRLGDERTRVHLEQVLGPGETARLGEARAHQRIASALERFIAGNGDQWCLFRRFWEKAA